MKSKCAVFYFWLLLPGLLVGWQQSSRRLAGASVRNGRNWWIHNCQQHEERSAWRHHQPNQKRSQRKSATYYSNFSRLIFMFMLIMLRRWTEWFGSALTVANDKLCMDSVLQESPDVAMDALVELFETLPANKRSEALRNLSHIDTFDSEQEPIPESWGLLSTIKVRNCGSV